MTSDCSVSMTDVTVSVNSTASRTKTRMMLAAG